MGKIRLRSIAAFIALIEATIYEVAVRDQAVILGRGSAFLLHDIPQVLKVRLFAPLEVRIERRMRQESGRPEDRGRPILKKPTKVAPAMFRPFTGNS